MPQVYLVPTWFLGVDVLFELTFAVIALIVGFFAFKVYRLSTQRQAKFLGISFLFFGASYLVQAMLNSIIFFELNESVTEALHTDVTTLNAVGIYVHMLLFMIGLLTLAYMTLQLKSSRAYVLISVLVLLPLIFTQNKVALFYIMSSAILIFIVIHYLLNFWRHRQLQTFLVLLAFAFLLFGSIHFILSVNQPFYYFTGHIMGVVAFLLILINLILIVKHGKKAR